MKYLVNNEQVNESTFWSTFENAINEMVENTIDDDIDEFEEMVKIGSLTYFPSQVLKAVDPIAYRCYQSDMANNYYIDYKYELEISEEVEIYGTIFAIENEEEAE